MNKLGKAKKDVAHKKGKVDSHGKAPERGRGPKVPLSLRDKRKQLREAQAKQAEKEAKLETLTVARSVILAYLKAKHVDSKVEALITSSLDSELKAMSEHTRNLDATPLTSKCTPRPNIQSPTHVYHATQTKSYMTAELMRQWILNVVIPWRLEVIKRDSLSFVTPMVLMLDRFSAHLHPAVLEVCRKNRIRVILIPAGCTDKLQPLDVAVNKPFKQFVK